MKWILIDVNNLPDGEVLAANFNKGKHGYKEKLIGYLYIKNSFSGLIIQCEDDHQVLEHCTHYIDIHKFDVE